MYVIRAYVFLMRWTNTVGMLVNVCGLIGMYACMYCDFIYLRVDECACRYEYEARCAMYSVCSSLIIIVRFTNHLSYAHISHSIYLCVYIPSN